MYHIVRGIAQKLADHPFVNLEFHPAEDHYVSRDGDYRNQANDKVVHISAASILDVKLVTVVFLCLKQFQGLDQITELLVPVVDTGK